MRRIVWGIVFVCSVSLLAAPLLAAEPPEVTQAAGQVAAACRLLQGTQPDAHGRRPDLELYTLAAVLDSLQEKSAADQYRRYLMNFYASSPLQRLLPAQLDEIAVENFDPNPDLSRLVAALYAQAIAAPAGQTPAFLAEGLELVQGAAAAPETLPAAAGLRDFLQRHPRSPLAGWAAYQLLWRLRLEYPDRFAPAEFQRFQAAHPDHPLGHEALEAENLTWVSPQYLAHLSLLLPGLGEETLEPGVHESAGAMYSEVLYWLGAAGFAVAAQRNSRPANLTGALIFINLLLLNHSTSSEQAYHAGLERNQAEQRRFIQGRLQAPILGSGEFGQEPYLREPAPESLDQDVILSLTYRQWGAGDVLRGQNLIQDDQLANLGLRLDGLYSVLDFVRTPGVVAGVGFDPYLRGFLTHADPLSGSGLATGLDDYEVSAGLEAALLLRFIFGQNWVQLQLSAGPGVRQRGLALDGATYGDRGSVWSGTAALSLGGQSGAYWRLGASVDDSLATGEFDFRGRHLTVPGRGVEIQSSLGVRF